MALSVRKAAWAATKATPIELISRAARGPTVHQYKEGETKGADMIKVMAERHLVINAGRERLDTYPDDTLQKLHDDVCELLAKSGLEPPPPALTPVPQPPTPPQQKQSEADEKPSTRWTDGLTVRPAEILEKHAERKQTRFAQQVRPDEDEEEAEEEEKRQAKLPKLRLQPELLHHMPSQAGQSMPELVLGRPGELGAPHEVCCRGRRIF